MSICSKKGLESPIPPLEASGNALETSRLYHIANLTFWILFKYFSYVKFAMIVCCEVNTHFCRETGYVANTRFLAFFCSDLTQINAIWLGLYSDIWTKKSWLGPLIVKRIYIQVHRWDIINWVLPKLIARTLSMPRRVWRHISVFPGGWSVTPVLRFANTGIGLNSTWMCSIRGQRLQWTQIIWVCPDIWVFSVLDNRHLSDIWVICQKCQFGVRKGWKALFLQLKPQEMHWKQADSGILKI